MLCPARRRAIPGSTMLHQAAHMTELGHGILAVDTDYIRPLLDASHLVVAGDRAAFVDTGTNHSVDLLLDALSRKDLDVGQVDFVFLTHVHLDHAGGAGRLMRRLPNAKAVLHPRGARHMTDPGRLIAGSRAVYGNERFAEMYGDVEAIPVGRILVADDGQEFRFGGREVRTLFTEGHARHHYCLVDPASRGVFTGDSFGVSYRELDTAAGEFIFPTTTPVHFDPPEAHKAVDRILLEEPEHLYLTHYSRVGEPQRLASDMHRRLDDFVAIATRLADEADRTNAMQEAMFHYLKDALFDHGMKADDARLHALLDMDIQLNTMGIEYWLDHRK
jgi:glyoxylase-like metal-dependent hydrolase (beta-lactamase superfamily II)